MDVRSLFSLEGKRALVTGGTSGMGAAVCEAYAALGAQVAVVGRDAARGEEVAARAGSGARFFACDVTDPAACDLVVAAVCDAFGGLDVLVNAAGVFLTGPAEELSDEEFDRVMRINVYGTFQMCRAAGRVMIPQGSGKIINFSSTDAYLGVPNQPVYCASKGAVNQLTRVLAVDWIKHGINVNAIGPCDFDTPMIAAYLDTDEYRDWILDALPAGRVGRPHEIVGAAVYLASEASTMVVGHTLMVDGGRTVI